jgi:hypothetical protein
MSYKKLLRRIIAVWAAAAIVSGCVGAAPARDAVGDFSIHLVKEGLSAQRVMDMNLSELQLEQVPILSTDDIVMYTWETHEIELTDSARERIARLKVPVQTGVPFVACVGAQRVYSGAFWTSESSMSFDGIVIDTLFARMDGHPIRIQLGYPGRSMFEGADPRSDPRILQSLRKAVKLGK